MEWLEADLKKIEESELVITLGSDDEMEPTVITDDRGSVVYDNSDKVNITYAKKSAQHSTPVKKVIKVTQMLCGDFAFHAYCLGKENSSSAWCIYCMLRNHEWSVYPKNMCGRLWDMNSLTAMARSSNKGADRLGVKCEPKFPWITIINRILPKLHQVIGLINDVIVYFETQVEWTIIMLPPVEKIWKARVQELNDIIPALEQAVRDWQSEKGDERTRLMGKVRNSKRKNAKTMTPMTREEAEAEARFKVLDAELIPLQKKRDDAQGERKKLKEKFAERTSKRIVDTKSWYIPMEQIYTANKIKREDYHKRKFSGRPLNVMMKNAASIFGEAKTMLKMHKDPDIDESKVDALCDRVTGVLRSWKTVFDILSKGGKPTDEDKASLEAAIAVAIDKHRVCNSPYFTPKAHTMDVHALWQYSHHTNLPLIIEEFVERNHQDGMKIDSRTKRMPDKEKRANTTAKRKAFATIGSIQKQIKLVHDGTSRGKYVMSGKYAKKAQPETPATLRSAVESVGDDTPMNMSGMNRIYESIMASSSPSPTAAAAAADTNVMNVEVD